MAIVNRPHNPQRYLEYAIADLDRLIAKASEACALVGQHHGDGSQMTRSWLRYGSDHADAADEIHGAEALARSFDRYLPIRQVRDDLDAVRRHGADFLRYVLSTRDHAREIPQSYRDLLGILDSWEKGALEYGYELDDPANEEDPEFVAARSLLEGCRGLRDVIAEAEPFLADLWARLEVWQEIRAMAHRIEEWRPRHAEIEPLWHATAFAPELVRNGFDADGKPEGCRGLGLLGKQDEVSFTHEPEVAYTIAACLRELWAIAHGHLTAADLAARIRAEGIDEERIRNALGLGKGMDEVSGDRETAKLYNVYLWLSERRDNPVFTGIEETMEMLKGRRLDDIGVVVCDVRLTGNEAYKIAESEFIVPPGQVQAVNFDPDDPGPVAVGLDLDLEPSPPGPEEAPQAPTR